MSMLVNFIRFYIFFFLFLFSLSNSSHHQQQGIKEGEGKLKDKDFTYEGGFLGNYFHGLGKWEHVDGAVYLGFYIYLYE